MVQQNAVGTPLDEVNGGTGQTTITAGDILYGSAANTLSKLAKANDNDILTLSSGLPAWSTPFAGLLPPPDIAGTVIGTDTYKTTGWMLQSTSPSLGTSSLGNSDEIQLFPVYFPYSGSYTKIATILTGGNGAGNYRFGLWNIAAGLPTTVLVDSGSISTAATGLKEVTGLSFSITAGWYYFGTLTTLGGILLRRMQSTMLGFAAYPFSATDLVPYNTFRYSFAYAALPTITASSLVPQASVIPTFYIA